jgi:hypothetical protein
MDIIYGDGGGSSTSGNSTNENNSEQNSDTILSEITPETFLMPEQVEKSLDFYLTKLDEYRSKIGEDKADAVSQKALAMEAILETDMLKID